MRPWVRKESIEVKEGQKPFQIEVAIIEVVIIKIHQVAQKIRYQCSAVSIVSFEASAVKANFETRHLENNAVRESDTLVRSNFYCETVKTASKEGRLAVMDSHRFVLCRSIPNPLRQFSGELSPTRIVLVDLTT